MDMRHDGLPVAGALSSATRIDGFTPARKVRFLHHLAQVGNVRAACRAAGTTPQTAYLARRRDYAFACGWDAAMVLALDHHEQVLASFALEGVEESVWFRGELAGTRTRFDTRLFLAHLTRLDRHAENALAQRHAARFDELLALVAGERFEAGIGEIDRRGEEADPVLPCWRKDHVERVEAAWRAGRELGENDDASEEEQDARSAEFERGVCEVREMAARQWDDWEARALAGVDAALAEGEAADSRETRPGLCQQSQLVQAETDEDERGRSSHWRTRC